MLGHLRFQMALRKSYVESEFFDCSESSKYHGEAPFSREVFWKNIQDRQTALPQARIRWRSYKHTLCRKRTLLAATALAIPESPLKSIPMHRTSFPTSPDGFPYLFVPFPKYSCYTKSKSWSKTRESMPALGTSFRFF